MRILTNITLFSLAAVLGGGLATINPIEAAGLPKPRPDQKPAVAAADGSRSQRASGTPRTVKPSGPMAAAVSPDRLPKTPAESHPRKTGRHRRAMKKAQTRLQAKPDRSYHGLLHQPRRYDPSQGRRGSGGAPNPHAVELLHDHFQELDKNRDGVIDPFERVSGRLDIDRDLANHRWQ